MKTLKKIYESADLEQDRERDFEALANGQRGRPEQAMQTLTESQICQLYGYVTEHVGDLTHRMAQRPKFFEGGFEWVSPKVENCLYKLTYSYGFYRECIEQIKSNFAFGQRKGEYSDKTWVDLLRELKELSKKYANEHRRLKVWNEAQWLAREAAISLGEWRFKDTIKYLEELGGHLDKGREHWEEYSMQYTGQEFKR